MRVYDAKEKAWQKRISKNLYPDGQAGRSVDTVNGLGLLKHQKPEKPM